MVECGFFFWQMQVFDGICIIWNHPDVEMSEIGKWDEQMETFIRLFENVQCESVNKRVKVTWQFGTFFALQTAIILLEPCFPHSFPFLVPGPHDQWAVGMSYEKLNADCFNFTEDMATPTKRKIENVSLLSFYHNF